MKRFVQIVGTGFAILVCAFVGVQTTYASTSFVDVDSTYIYAKEIDYLKREKISLGFNNGTEYRPDTTITREMLVTLIVKAVYTPEDIEKCIERNGWQGENIFKDVSLDHHFAPYICMAKEKKVAVGFSSGDFGLSRAVKAHEAIKMIMRAIDKDLKLSMDAPLESYTHLFNLMGLYPPTIDIAGESEHEMTRAEIAYTIQVVRNGYTPLANNFYYVLNAENGKHRLMSLNPSKGKEEVLIEKDSIDLINQINKYTLGVRFDNDFGYYEIRTGKFVPVFHCRYKKDSKGRFDKAYDLDGNIIRGLYIDRDKFVYAISELVGIGSSADLYIQDKFSTRQFDSVEGTLMLVDWKVRFAYSPFGEHFFLQSHGLYLYKYGKQDGVISRIEFVQPEHQSSVVNSLWLSSEEIMYQRSKEQDMIKYNISSGESQFVHSFPYTVVGARSRGNQLLYSALKNWRPTIEILDLETRKAKQLATDASYPFWVSDKEIMYFGAHTGNSSSYGCLLTSIEDLYLLNLESGIRTKVRGGLFPDRNILNAGASYFYQCENYACYYGC
jgi:hypothetical protein